MPSKLQLYNDPIHGYMEFSDPGERSIIDDPWVQRLRYIHQLQGAWWVFAGAEHTRFQHVLGVMHLAGKAAERLYPSLKKACRNETDDFPRRNYVFSTMRLAGLLHDIGHGPFGHAFDEYVLRRRGGITHEDLGRKLICEQLREKIEGIKESRLGRLDHSLQPNEIAYLITRDEPQNYNPPLWLRLLRVLFAGVYTVDNMDFVLRDAYMAGYSSRAFDLERLLYYSEFFNDPQSGESGLQIEERGRSALLRFLYARAELFRNIYFHRIARAFDLSLKELLRDTCKYLLPGGRTVSLDRYLNFTEWSLWVDVSRWLIKGKGERRELGQRWAKLRSRDFDWKPLAEREETLSRREEGWFGDQKTAHARLTTELRKQGRAPAGELYLDVARLRYRQEVPDQAGGNFLYDVDRKRRQGLNGYSMIRQLPKHFHVVRVYGTAPEDRAAVSRALDAILGGRPAEPKGTNI